VTRYRQRREAGEFQPEGEAAAEPATALDEMNKAELLTYAQQLGVSPANNAMSKDELRAGVDAKLAEG
jgi:hypothetical protein